MNSHNDLLNRGCRKKPGTFATLIRICAGWAVVLVIMAMIAVATVSPA